MRARQCDRHCPKDQAKLVTCCANLGYQVGGYCSVMAAFCLRQEAPTTMPTTEMPTTEMTTTELSNEEMIHNLKSENSRLKSEQESCHSTVEQFQEEINVCNREHKKYVESMARTKAIIENILAGKNGQ